MDLTSQNVQNSSETTSVATDNGKPLAISCLQQQSQKIILKQGKSLKEKLFQGRAGSVRERFVIL